MQNLDLMDLNSLSFRKPFYRIPLFQKCSKIRLLNEPLAKTAVYFKPNVVYSLF